MRTPTILLVTLSATALVSPTSVAAQQPNPAPASQAAAPSPTPSLFDPRASNFIDFGVRGTAFSSDSDEARYQRYRDLRNGGTLDAFRFTDETDRRSIALQADHTGYRDQRYSAAFNSYGKVKASFEWNQV